MCPETAVRSAARPAMCRVVVMLPPVSMWTAGSSVLRLSALAPRETELTEVVEQTGGCRCVIHSTRCFWLAYARQAWVCVA